MFPEYRHPCSDDAGQGAHGDVRKVHPIEPGALPQCSRARRWLVGRASSHSSLPAQTHSARHVIAIDASPITEKVRQIVKDNGLENIVTVVCGRIVRSRRIAEARDRLGTVMGDQNGRASSSCNIQL